MDPATLWLPQDSPRMPESKLPSDIQLMIESRSTDPYISVESSTDAECSDDDYDNHRTLSQHIREATDESTYNTSLSNKNPKKDSSYPSIQAASTKANRFTTGAKGVDHKILKQGVQKTDSKRTAKVLANAVGSTLSESVCAKEAVLATVVLQNAERAEVDYSSTTGVEVGATAEASAEARGADIEVGKANVKGAKIRAKTSAKEKTEFKVQTGTLDITRAELTAKVTPRSSAKRGRKFGKNKQGTGNPDLSCPGMLKSELVQINSASSPELHTNNENVTSL